MLAMKLSIVVVNMNSIRFLRPCLRSVFEETERIDFEVIVVDNASTDGSCEMLAIEFPSARVIVNQENIGFAAANNQGIKASQGEYILLLNPDTEILDSAIEKTITFMAVHPNAAVVGCKLLFPDGRLQRSVGAFPCALNAFLEASFLYLLMPKTRLVSRRGFVYFDYSVEKEVDWVMGAYFMIRRSSIQELGPLDEQFYMYAEETDFCLRAKNAGREVWFVPAAKVIHHWGGMSAVNRRVILWVHLSQHLFLQKHYSGMEKHAISMFRFGGALCRVVVYSAVGLFTLNRQMFAKARYFADAIVLLSSRRWLYNREPMKQMIPWTRFT